MKRTLLGSVALVFLVYCLMLVVAAQNWLGLSIKKELDAVSLASLAMSVFIVFFIQYFFVGRASDLRTEKDFLIGNQKEALKAGRECRDAIDKAFDSGKITQASQDKIKLSLRELANALEVFEESLRSSQCTQICGQFASTKSAYYKFKSIATGGSFPSSPYTMSTMVAVEREYRLLRRELQEWFFRINRFHS
jgi:hypothetical protein